MTQDIHLYSYRRCPFAIRVRMVLHEKGLPFVTHEENLRDFSATIREHHPEAKIPLLRHGESYIYESAVITEYLDEQFPSPALMPPAPHERAQVRLWTHWMNHHMKPDIDRMKYGSSRFPESEIAPATERMVKHLAKLEARLAAASWLVGEQLSLADLHCFPFVRQLNRMTPRPDMLDQYPKTMQWLTRIMQRPSFEATMRKPERSSS